jgi:protein-S-isoprenylcysteine O-methyltransferase Ste14
VYPESVFRGLFVLSGVAMLCIRVYHQRHARQGSGAVIIREMGWSLAAGSLAALLFVIKAALEDRILQAELPGYRDYAERVRYRLLPGVW